MKQRRMGGLPQLLLALFLCAGTPVLCGVTFTVSARAWGRLEGRSDRCYLACVAGVAPSYEAVDAWLKQTLPLGSTREEVLARLDSLALYSVSSEVGLSGEVRVDTITFPGSCARGICSLCLRCAATPPPADWPERCQHLTYLLTYTDGRLRAVSLASY